MLNETPGRYYFSPPGTPFYDGWHNLGSKAWRDKNWLLAQGLGEDVTAKMPWDDGRLPSYLPLPQSVGSVDCLANGEGNLLTDSVPYEQLIDGFVPACFIPQPGTVLPFDFVSDPSSCSNQLLYARIIEWLYAANAVSIADLLHAWIGNAAVVTFHEGTTLYPSLVTVRTPGYALCIVSGTANYQQFALEALYSLIRPFNYGILSTNSQWYAASSWIQAALVADGIDGTLPIFLCGHSYGAVAALILAARFRSGSPNRVVKFLTFGSPKIGDQRFVTLLSSCIGYAIANDTDLVTALPPNLAALFPVETFLGNPLLLVWTEWQAAPFQILLAGDGSQTFDGAISLDFATLLTITLDVLATVPLPSLPGHAIGEYFSRIANRCPDAEWPVPPPIYVKIFVPDGILLEIGDNVLVENTGIILLES
jgi:pimeloyl-ACP methyl ester carboxylesterase